MQLTRSVAFVPAAEAVAVRRAQRRHLVVVAAAGQGFASGGASKKASSSTSSKKVRRGACTVCNATIPSSSHAQAIKRMRGHHPTSACRTAPCSPPRCRLSSSLPQQPKLARYLEVQMPAGAADKGSDDGWVEIPDVDVATSFLSKPIKPIILATGRALCLYKVRARAHACDLCANFLHNVPAQVWSVAGQPAGVVRRKRRQQAPWACGNTCGAPALHTIPPPPSFGRPHRLTRQSMPPTPTAQPTSTPWQMPACYASRARPQVGLGGAGQNVAESMHACMWGHVVMPDILYLQCCRCCAALTPPAPAPAVEVALDGTVYDLATGKVLSWCPKNTLARQVLGGLKDKTEPQDLPVYPVQLRPGGKVAVKFI